MLLKWGTAWRCDVTQLVGHNWKKRYHSYPLRERRHALCQNANGIRTSRSVGGYHSAARSVFSRTDDPSLTGDVLSSALSLMERLSLSSSFALSLSLHLSLSTSMISKLIAHHTKPRERASRYSRLNIRLALPVMDFQL